MQVDLKEKKGIAGAFLWELTCEKLLYAQIASKKNTEQAGRNCKMFSEEEGVRETDCFIYSWGKQRGMEGRLSLYAACCRGDLMRWSN